MRALWIHCVLLLAGCGGTVSFLVPESRFEAPYVTGKGRGELGLGSVHNVEYVTINDYHATPPESSGSQIQEGPQHILPYISGGLTDTLELGYSVDGLKMKWQFLGSPQKHKINQQWVASAFINAGYQRSSKSTEYQSDPPIYQNASLRNYWLGSGLVAGYRFNSLTIYASLSQMRYRAITEITHKNVQVTKYTYRDSPMQSQNALGLRWQTQRFYLAVEQARSFNQLDRANDFHSSSTNVIVGRYF